LVNLRTSWGLRMRTKLSVGALGFLLPVALLLGCSPKNQTNLDRINSGNAALVAQVCSSQETLDNIKSVVFAHIDISGQDPPLNSAYKDQLSAGGVVSLEVPTLSSFDATTKKVSCSAKITFTWPNDLVNRLKVAQPTGSWATDTTDGAYTIQPQADGQGLVYSIDGPTYDNTVGSVLTMLRTLAGADAEAQAAAAAKKTEAIAVSSSSPSDVPPDSASSLSAQTGNTAPAAPQ